MYTWILIKIETDNYIGWSKSKDKPLNNNTDIFEWYEWNKSLPSGIEENNYTLTTLSELDLTSNMTE